MTTETYGLTSSTETAQPSAEGTNGSGDDQNSGQDGDGGLRILGASAIWAMLVFAAITAVHYAL